MQKYIILTLLTFNFLLGNQADHIIFTQITTSSDEAAQVVAIYNPKDEAIDLSNYYLSDAESSTKHYYNLPTENNYWSGSQYDFIVRFPVMNINPGQTLTISINDASTFNSYYSFNPDLTLTDDMLDALDGQSTIGSSADLADNYESLILFYWDGSSSIVQDVDYFYWGNPQGLTLYGIDKTGIPGYLDDTPFNIQTGHILEAHDSDYSYVRKSTTESGESGPSNNITGNGITGHDETSEIFNQSWEIILNPLQPEPIAGCADDTACNYDENAGEDDGSCEYSCYGCMDEEAINFVPSATIDNGACNISGDSIQYMIEQNQGSECDENLSSSYQIIGLVIGYADIRPSGGPQVIVLKDDNDYQIEIVVWDWDVASSAIGFMVDPYDPSEYVMYVQGTLGTYNCSWQFEVAGANDMLLYDIYHPQGNLVEDPTIIKAEIVTAPYVIIPSLGERLDFHYSFPSNSRVIIRILDLNGLFITSLVDKFYQNAGKVERYEDSSDWNGRDHLGQIVTPGTYLIHIEASNFQSGKTSVDIAPIVVGVHH
jgi:hypothetical protein